MKIFVLASLIAASATGCIIASDNSSDAAHVGATWKIKDVAGAPQPCPAGVDTAALVDQPIDAAGNNVGQPIIDVFLCSDGGGTSLALPPTTYQTWIQLTDHSGNNVYARSVATTLDVTTTDLTYNADILTDGGYFQLTWALTKAGAPTTCSAEGAEGSASGVELTATVAGSSMALTDQFTCDDGSGITSGYPAGNYTVSVDAFTGAGAIGTAPAINSAVIHDKNQVTDLGTVMIPIQ
jgi:hypothetical protein